MLYSAILAARPRNRVFWATRDWLTPCGKADHRDVIAEQVQREFSEPDMALAAVLRGLELASADAPASLGVRLDGLTLTVSTTVTTTTITGGRCGAG